MPPDGSGRLHKGMNADAIAVLIESLTRTYGSGPGTVTALDRVTLAFPAGSFTAVMGPSGSGKSTLLQCAAGLRRARPGRARADLAAPCGYCFRLPVLHPDAVPDRRAKPGVAAAAGRPQTRAESDRGGARHRRPGRPGAAPAQ